MIKIANRLEDVLTVLYDYEYIDIEKFYNHKENRELLELLNKVIDNGEASQVENEMLLELEKNLSSFISFETNHNSDIGSF